MRAVITGATAGIGEEFAKQLHERGFRLVLLARRKEILERQVEHFNSQRSDSAEYICCDLCKREELRDFETWLAVEQYDLVVNNAGHGSFGYYHSLDFDWEQHMIHLNVVAFSRIAQVAAKKLQSKKSGKIINISSVAAFQPLPFMATYSASKAFDFHLSLSMGQELRSQGVQVLTVCPGPVATEFGGVARVPGTLTGSKRDSADKVVRESLEALDRGRLLVLPCLKAKLLGALLKIFPVRLSTWIVYRVLKDVLDKSENGERSPSKGE